MTEVADALGLVADLLSIAVVGGALALWLLGRNPMVVRTLRADRQRTVGAVLESTGMSRSVVRRAVKECTADYVNGRRAPTLQAELDWLDSVVGERGGATPVAYFGLPGPTASPTTRIPDSLSSLSTAYRSLALRLKGRGLLGGGTSPLLDNVAEVGEGLARLLAKNATFAAGRLEASACLRLEIQQATTRLELSSLRPTDAPGAGADDLAVTYVPRRMVVAKTVSQKIAELDGIPRQPLELDERELELLGKRFEGKTFDGVLPSLKMSSFERDPASGRSRLHLVLAEASFSSVMVTHYVGESGVGRAQDALTGEAQLLTLAILPTTRDGYFVLTTRTQHVSVTAGMLSPAVTGNLEMRDRVGLPVDRDADGFPDPLLALARECREELGLDIDREHIEIIGTMRFASPHEVGTTVLLATTQLDASLQDVADATRHADRIEGAWESEERITGVPVPRTPQERIDLLAWTLSDQGHVPHLAGCLIAYCYPLVCDDLGDVDTANRRLAELAQSPTPAPPPPGIATVVPSAGGHR